ncbi:MAG: DUF2911 domain-containing protein [Bacteroidia bacterium]
MKILKWTGIVILALVVLAFAGYKYMQWNTKQSSPEETVEYKQGDLELEVFYNRPYKKDREIFGSLVPYDQVWRTGANEATTFKTNKDLTIDGKTLPAGKYTLWTIPGEKSWTVIFNTMQYSWGVNFDGVASREAEYDALEVKVPVQRSNEVVEQFTISFKDNNNLSLELAWDQSRVEVPFE